MRIFCGVGRNVTVPANGSDGRLCIINFFIWVKLLPEVDIPCQFLEQLIYKYDKPSHERRAASALTVD